MTTSPKPWTLELKPDGFTYMKDASGEQIAKFLHGQDAENLLDVVTAFSALEESLEHDKDVLEQRIGNYLKTIESLEQQIEESKTKL